MYQNLVYICISWYSKTWGEKMLMPAELKGCVTWFIYFLDLLWVRYSSAKFHNIGYVWLILGRGPFCPPSCPWAVLKRPILNRFKLQYLPNELRYFVEIFYVIRHSLKQQIYWVVSSGSRQAYLCKPKVMPNIVSALSGEWV